MSQRFFVRAPDGNVLNIVGPRRHTDPRTSASSPRTRSRTQPADPDCFTGDVTRADVLPRRRPAGLQGNVFTYAPGARSSWHVHEGEQALIVVRGEGLVQWEGLETREQVRAGDSVHVHPVSRTGTAPPRTAS